MDALAQIWYESIHHDTQTGKRWIKVQKLAAFLIEHKFTLEQVQAFETEHWKTIALHAKTRQPGEKAIQWVQALLMLHEVS